VEQRHEGKKGLTTSESRVGIRNSIATKLLRNDYVAKPVTPDELLATVAHHLDTADSGVPPSEPSAKPLDPASR